MWWWMSRTSSCYAWKDYWHRSDSILSFNTAEYGVRWEVPDAAFDLAGDRVIPVVALVCALQKSADLTLVFHLKNCDPDLRPLIVRRGPDRDLVMPKRWNPLPMNLCRMWFCTIRAYKMPSFFSQIRPLQFTVLHKTSLCSAAYSWSILQQMCRKSR